MTLGAWLVMGVVNLGGIEPAGSSILRGTNNINFTFVGNVDVNVSIYNGTAWIELCQETNTTVSPYNCTINTAAYDDKYQYYNISINVTNTTVPSDSDETIISDLTFANDGVIIAITTPIAGAYDGFLNHTINATYDTTASGINVTTCSYIIYAPNFTTNLTTSTAFTLANNVSSYMEATLLEHSLAEGSERNLVVSCTDIAGIVSNDTVQFGYDHTSPVAELNTITYASGTYNIVGNVSDVGLGIKVWNITVQNDTANITICTNTDTRANVMLCQWNTLDGNYTDGNYYNVTLVVEDNVNHTSTAVVSTITVDNTPPTVALVNSSFNVSTSNATVWFNFTDASATAACSLYVDGAVNASNASVTKDENTALTITDILDGVHAVSVMCTDLAGNPTTSAPINVTMDMTAPVITPDLTTILTNDNGTDIYFKYTDAVAGSANCSLIVDGVVKASNATTQNNMNTTLSLGSTPLADGVYVVDINCTENTGFGFFGSTNLSQSIGLTIDTIKPTVASVTLSDPTPTKAGNLTVVIVFTEPSGMNYDVDPVVSFTMPNGSVYTLTESNYTGSNTWTGYYDMSSETNDGTVIINITAAGDAAGNIMLDDEITPFVFDSTVPTITNSLPANGTRWKGSINFSVDLADTNGVDLSMLTLRNSSGSVGLPDLFNGTNLSGTYNTSVSTSSFADGAHVVYYSVRDYAGNAVSGGNVAFIVDNTAPAVVINSPGTTNYTNTTVLAVNFTVTDDLAQGMVCSLNATNGTATLTNASAALNASSPVFIIYGLTQGSWTWNVTCHDNATPMGSGNVGNSNTTTSRTYIVDQTPVVIFNVTLKEPDFFVSGTSPNDGITIMVNASDVAVKYVQVNFDDLTGAGLVAINATYNATSGYYEAITTLTADTFDFQAFNITVEAGDNASNSFIGLNYTTVILYNFTTPPSDSCMRWGSLTTDLSEETDFSDVNYVIDVELNGSAACNGIMTLPWGEGNYARVLLMNFSSVDMSNPETGVLLEQLRNAVNVTLPPPGQFGDMRIYVDSLMIAALNTTANLTFYNLPFASAPDVEADFGAAGVNGSVTWAQNVYNATWGVLTGNLTFTVNGFSGYNVTDNTTPSVVVNYPTAGLNTGDNTTRINVTLNGTDSQISQAIFYIGATEVARYNATVNTASCANDTPGSERFSCQFDLSSENGDGAKVLTVVAYDYGGSLPGNVANATRSFTIDTTAPTVTLTLPASNSYQLASYAITGTVNDSLTGVSYVEISVNGTAVGNATVAGAAWNYTRTSADGSVENITATAYDFAGVSATANITNITVDGVAPVVTLTSPAVSTVYNSSNMSFTYTAADARSGVSVCQYSLNSAANVTLASCANTSFWLWNGTHTVTLYVNDSVGNMNTTTRSFNISDVIAPVITASSPAGEQAAGTTTVTLSVTTDESASCRYGTSDVAYVNMTSNFTDSITAHTASYTVADSTSYTVYVRCNDLSNNTNAASTALNFSVAAASSGGRSGGGGASSLSPVLSQSPRSVILTSFGKYDFKTADMLQHTIRIVSFNGDSMTFRITSTPIDVTLKPGEQKEVDLSGDGKSDVVLKLNSMTTTSATFTMALPGGPATTVTEPTPPVTTPTTPTGGAVTEPAAGGQETTPPAAQPSADSNVEPVTEPVKKSAWPWIILAAVIAIILIGFWAVKTKRISVD